MGSSHLEVRADAACRAARSCDASMPVMYPLTSSCAVARPTRRPTSTMTSRISWMLRWLKMRTFRLLAMSFRVRLDVGELDHEVRLERLSLLERAVDERTDHRLVALGLGRTLGVRADAAMRSCSPSAYRISVGSSVRQTIRCGPCGVRYPTDQTGCSCAAARG